MAYTRRPGKSGQSETKAPGRTSTKPGAGAGEGRGRRPSKEPREARPQKKQVRPPRNPDNQAPPPLEDALPYLIMGRNGVREALRSGRSIDRILVTKEQDGSLANW